MATHGAASAPARQGHRLDRASGAALPDGGALQAVYLLVELCNDAVEFRDTLLIAKGCALLDVFMLSHEVGLLALGPRIQDRRQTCGCVDVPFAERCCLS